MEDVIKLLFVLGIGLMTFGMYSGIQTAATHQLWPWVPFVLGALILLIVFALSEDKSKPRY